MTTRRYAGPALDHSWQYIGERPALEEETDGVVYATEPEPDGEETVEDVPVPEGFEEVDRPDVEGQSTFADWGWSA